VWGIWITGEDGKRLSISDQMAHLVACVSLESLCPFIVGMPSEDTERLGNNIRQVLAILTQGLMIVTGVGMSRCVLRTGCLGTASV